MEKRKESSRLQPEIEAISAVHTALAQLDQDAQLRVMRYVSEMLGLKPAGRDTDEGNGSDKDNGGFSTPTALPQPPSEVLQATHSGDDNDGISAVALRWIARSGLSAKALQNLFSLGVDEIDLVASTVPGNNKKERMRNVILLKGVAAYLGTGAARVTYEQVKEACMHYDAYDSSNFAAYLKSMAAEVSGSKEAGLTLTARGINSAKDLIKQILGNGT